MKIAAYEVRPDEKPVIEARCKELGIELILKENRRADNGS